MTQPTETFDSYDAVGTREDLSDIISIVEQEKTPFTSVVAGTSTATQRLHEWQTDSLDTAANNAVVEGDDIVGDAITATTREANRIQISEKSVTVSDVQNMVNNAGRKSEIAYQVEKQTKSIKRDMEKALLDNNAAVVGNATTASEMGGFPAWIQTNENTIGAAGGSSGSGTIAARTDGTQRAFTELLLKDVLKQGADSGANFDHILLGSFNKQKFSTFSGGSTRFSEDSSKAIVNTVDVYIGDFGEQKVMFSPQQRARDCLVMDSSLLNIAYLQNLTMFDLARTGASEKKAMRVHYTLEILNEKGNGGVFDLTTA